MPKSRLYPLQNAVHISRRPQNGNLIPILPFPPFRLTDTSLYKEIFSRLQQMGDPMLQPKQFLTLLWRFLGFFQAPFIRALHAALLILIFFQLFGGLMVSPHAYGLPLADSFILWGHGFSGILILLLGLLLIGISFRTNGLFHYFPYLLGEISQIRRDVMDSLHFKLVAPRAGGLANAVQGLGMGAMLLTALSGGGWILLRWQGLHINWLLDIHSLAAMMLALYFIGHGTMALLHFRLWLIKTGAAKKTA